MEQFEGSLAEYKNFYLVGNPIGFRGYLYLKKQKWNLTFDNFLYTI